jgi:hypothetical protein
MMNWIGIAIVGFGVTKDFLTLSGAGKRLRYDYLFFGKNILIYN